MDIFEQWKEIEETKFNNSPLKREDIMNAIYQESISTMESIKSKLKIKINWIIFFLCLFTAFGVYNYQNLEIVMVTLIPAIIYLAGYFILSRYHKKMSLDTSDRSTLEVMKSHYSNITYALATETRLGFTIFPVMIICGVLLGGLMKGETLLEIINNVDILKKVILSIVILVPLGIFAGNKMNKSAYGKFIDTLKENINRMESA